MGRNNLTNDNQTETVNLENGQCKPSKPKSACWNPQTIVIFCALCIKEVEKGQRPGTHFNAASWASLVENFHAETGNNYDRSQLKNKWDSLKKEWRLWKDLIGKETGLGWNPTKNIIDASDEWWRNKIQIDSKYANLRVRGLNPDMEAKLDLMFKGVVATGKYAWAPSGLPPPKNGAASKETISLEDNTDSSNDDQTGIASEMAKEIGRKRKDEPDTQTLKGKKSKVGGAAKLSREISRLVDIVETRSIATSTFIKSSQSTSVAKVMKVVDGLPGIEIGGTLWWFATKLFCCQEKKAMFTVLEDPEKKLQFLIRNQGKENNK